MCWIALRWNNLYLDSMGNSDRIVYRRLLFKGYPIPANNCMPLNRAQELTGRYRIIPEGGNRGGRTLGFGVLDSVLHILRSIPLHSVDIISTICRQYLSSRFHNDFLRYFGTNTTWYFHWCLTWAWLCHSLMMASYKLTGSKEAIILSARRNGRAYLCLTAKGGGLPKLN